MQIKDKNLYYVGGVVRDEILGVPSFDVDFCYEGDAIEFAQSFDVIKTNPDFGTVRIHTEEGEIDIASTRTESYPRAGHLPKINKLGCSLQEDLKRRDFTINAIAKNSVSGKIFDPFDGLSDIENKKLRVLHKNSFIEDPTRIVRGLKFSVRFGFELDKKTKELQDDYLNNINYDISYHRLKKELRETFNLNKKVAYDLFLEQRIYMLLGKKQLAHKIDSSVEELVDKYAPKNAWLIYLGQFCLDNLELTNEEASVIVHYNRIKNFKPNNDIDLFQVFNNIPLESILLYAVSVDKEIAINYLENLSKIKIEVDGECLSKLGITQGKIYKEIFNFLTEAKIINPSLSKDEEIELIKKRFL